VIPIEIYAMSQKSRPETNHDVHPKNQRVSRSGLWIGVGALILLTAFAVLVVITVYFVNEHSERTKFFTVNTLSLSVLVAIIVQAFIYRGQWKAMQSGLRQTDRVISEMQGQLDIVKRQTRIMGVQTKVMIKQGKIMAASVEETRNLVAQNERVVQAAEQTADLTAKSFRINSRAYVFISEATLESPISSGEFPLAKIVLKNSGRTPAYRYRVRLEQAFLAGEADEKARKGIMPDMRPLSKKGLGIIGAGDVNTLHPDRQSWKSPEDRELAIKGQATFHVWGLICYSDIFEKEHSCKFSLWARNPSVTRLSFGMFGNDIEEDDE
jgi:hypothetical protein